MWMHTSVISLLFGCVQLWYLSTFHLDHSLHHLLLISDGLYIGRIHLFVFLFFYRCFHGYCTSSSHLLTPYSVGTLAMQNWLDLHWPQRYYLHPFATATIQPMRHYYRNSFYLPNYKHNEWNSFSQLLTILPVTACVPGHWLYPYNYHYNYAGDSVLCIYVPASHSYRWMWAFKIDCVITMLFSKGTPANMENIGKKQINWDAKVAKVPLM